MRVGSPSSPLVKRSSTATARPTYTDSLLQLPSQGFSVGPESWTTPLMATPYTAPLFFSVAFNRLLPTSVHGHNCGGGGGGGVIRGLAAF